MRAGLKFPLIVSLLFYSLPSTAEPCKAGEIPKPLLEMIQKKDYAGAEANALRAVKASPNSQGAQLDLAKVYINSAIRSVVNFDFSAMGIDPEKGGTYHEITADMVKNNTSEGFAVDTEYGSKAEAQITKVIKRWPENRSLLYCLTKIKFYSRDHKQFLKTLHRTAKSFKDSEDEAVGFFLGYAKDYFDKEEIEKSADVYETLLGVFPDNAPLLSSLGVNRLYTGKTIEAMGFFDRAYKQAPQDEIIIGNIAEVSMLTGEFPKAERFLKIKADMFPDDTSLYFDLAMNAMHKGPANSLPYWEIYFQKNKLHPDGEQWVKAATLIRQAVKEGALTDGDMVSLANQFTGVLNAPKYAVAMMSYLQDNDRSEAAYPYQLSYAYDKGRNYDLEEVALKETHRRLQKQPSKHMELSENEIFYNLARTTYAQDRHEEALGYLDRMKTSAEEKANTGYLYGLVYTGMGRTKEARASLDLCLKSSTSENLKELCKRQLERL